MFRSKEKRNSITPLAQEVLDTVIVKLRESHKHTKDILFGLTDYSRYVPASGSWLAQQYGKSQVLRTMLLGTRLDANGRLVCPEYETLETQLRNIREKAIRDLSDSETLAMRAMDSLKDRMELELERMTRSLLSDAESKPESDITDATLMEELLKTFNEVDWMALDDVRQHMAMRAAAGKAVLEQYRQVLDELEQAGK